MWPKAFAQFVELAPHISRLLPMADRFLQSKATGDDTGRRSLESAAAGVAAATATLGADLNRLAEGQSSLAAQMTALSSRVTTTGDEVRQAAQAAAASELLSKALDSRLQGAELQLGGLQSSLDEMNRQLGRLGERLRLGPVVLLLSLANLILLGAVVALLVQKH